MYTQSADHVLNPQTDIHFAIRTSFGDTVFPHAHDFFEFFLVLEGTQEYVSGNARHILLPGTLVLVRPGEAHSRRFLTPGMHINVAFPSKAADSLFAYLGPGFPAQELLDLSNIPSAVLLQNEKENWKKRLEELGALNLRSPEVIRTRLRIILLVSDYGITDICYDSGFNSLSHFYHVFQKEFGCSPGAFRQGKQPRPCQLQ